MNFRSKRFQTSLICIFFVLLNYKIEAKEHKSNYSGTQLKRTPRGHTEVFVLWLSEKYVPGSCFIDAKTKADIFTITKNFLISSCNTNH